MWVTREEFTDSPGEVSCDYFTFRIPMEFFRRIGFALAFSPTAEALLSETIWLTRLFHAELILIHVGKAGEREHTQLRNIFAKVGLRPESIKIVWEQGDPADRILKVCTREGIDLLVAGALKRENLIRYYIGTIARKIMRRADCSLMMITSPSLVHQPIRNIVINAEDSPFVDDALALACKLGQTGEKAWIHIVREIKLYGLAMSITDQHTEDEYSDVKQQLLRDEIDYVDGLLSRIPHNEVKINVKMLSGKSGFELCKFAQRKQADWLVVGAPHRRFRLFDRVFPHDLEYIFADLPCNLLIVNQGKGVARG